MAHARLPKGHDYNGTQYWSDVVNVIPSDETQVLLALEQLALDLTHDPNPVRFDGKPPVFRPARIQVASIGSLAGILLQGIIAQIPAEKVYYFINDHLGTPLKLMDENGQVVWSADYQPFGEAALSTETVTNNFRFPGQYYDQETALHYNYHRYYNPHTGRYLTPDPLNYSQIQILRRLSQTPSFESIQRLMDFSLFYQSTFITTQDLHLYPYALNNAVNWVDPFGLFNRGDIINWAGSVGAVIAREGGLISAKLATRLSIVASVVGELIDPRTLNSGEEALLENYRTMKEIEEVNMKISEIQRSLKPMLDKLNIPYDRKYDNICE